MEEEKSLLGEFNADDIAPEPTEQEQFHDHKCTAEKQRFEKPEDVPDEYWDKDSGVLKGDELFKALKVEQQKALGLRQKLSKGHQNVPQEASAYQVQLADDVEIEDDDGGIELFKGIAFKNNLSQEQFNGVVAEFFNAYKEGALGENDNDDSEIEKERDDQFYEAEMSKLGENAKQVISNAKGFGRVLIQNGIMSEELYPDFLKMATNANQVKILNMCRQAMGFMSDVPIDVGGIPGIESQEEIDKIMRDSTYDSDPVKQKKVADYYNRKYSS